MAEINLDMSYKGKCCEGGEQCVKCEVSPCLCVSENSVYRMTEI